MSFTDKLSKIAADALGGMASIVVGTVVSFDQESRTATVRATHRSGRGYDFFEVPWPSSPTGLFANAPVLEAPGRPGTHTVIGFRGSDTGCPVILSAYDPFHAGNTRQRDRRSLESYATRSDRAAIGRLRP